MVARNPTHYLNFGQNSLHGQPLDNRLKKYLLLQRQKTVSSRCEAVKLGSVDFYHCNSSVFPDEKAGQKAFKGL